MVSYMWGKNGRVGRMKIEFIEEYIRTGNDYQWNDNHGELVRCKKCKHWRRDEINGINVDGEPIKIPISWCSFDGVEESTWGADDFCSRAERRGFVRK